ncbi:MAG: 3-hydroxyacyl-CoA dehydrogenase NAD-binding domain-containing protein [Acidobacteriaceae bacterium]
MPVAAANNPIQRVAVLGAGTMGSRIAAHVANAGFPVLLLDMALPGERERNRLAAQSLESLKKSKPPERIAATLQTGKPLRN